MAARYAAITGLLSVSSRMRRRVPVKLRSSTFKSQHGVENKRETYVLLRLLLLVQVDR